MQRQLGDARASRNRILLASDLSERDRALLRGDAPLALREALEEGQAAERPIWRGSAARTVLEQKTFTAVAGTQRILAQGTCKGVHAGCGSDDCEHLRGGHQKCPRRALGDLPILLDASARSEESGDLVVLNRHFTYEPLALALTRGNEDFRLAVDRRNCSAICWHLLLKALHARRLP